MTFDAATIDAPAFELADVPAFYEGCAADARNVAAELAAGLRYERRVAKRAAEHQLHVANAAEHLGRLPDEGESLHCVMKGNYHAWDLCPALLRLAAPAVVRYLGIATLGFNRQNAQELIELVDAGSVERVDFICSCYFKSTSGDEFAFLHGQLAARGQRAVAVRSHAKIMLFELSDARCYVIESSANLRSCRNIEQFALTRDAGLLAFHRSWMTTLIDDAWGCSDGRDARRAG